MQNKVVPNREYKAGLFAFIFHRKEDLLSLYNAVNGSDYRDPDKLEIPVLRYYVFYNGTRKMEDETTLYLTDSMKGEGAAELSCAQFKAHMININKGHSPKIMEKCPLLYEYSYFVAAVREKIDGETSLMEAIDGAVAECIREGILADILRAHRAEVTDMLLKEYDEEFHISCEKKISYEDGYEDGMKQGNARADAANRKVEILTRKLRGCSDEEIATALDMSVEAVKECVSGALKDSE